MTKSCLKWQKCSTGCYLQGNGFVVAYNPHPDIGCEGSETALILEGSHPLKNRYLILLGDWRGEYEPLVDKGYLACKDFYDSKKDEFRSKWSDDNDYSPTKEEAIAILVAAKQLGLR